MRGEDRKGESLGQTLPLKTSISITGSERISRYAEPRLWTPTTFKAVFFIPILFATFSIALAIGYIQYRNASSGGILFANRPSGPSPFQNFIVQYFPILVVLLYGIIWSWIDLDVKRLEPWYQAAHVDGSSSQTSLCLQYPVEFLPLVPFKAAKKKYVQLACLQRID